MGYYINPDSMTKEEYLKGHGRDVGLFPCAFDQVSGDDVLVCHVNNVIFTAAAIAFDQREYDTFMKGDGRIKRWYLLSRADAIRASDWDGGVS